TTGAFNLSQFPAQNVAVKQFVGAADGSDFYSFTLTQPSNIIIRYDGTPELVALRFGRDLNGNGFLGDVIDRGPGLPPLGEVFPQEPIDRAGNVVYSPLPPIFDPAARWDSERQAFLTTVPTDIYARLEPGTYYLQVDAQAIQTNLGDGLVRYGSSNVLYNLSFILEPPISNG
ncbi:MAG: hypothetical protein ACKO7W_18200, partial [Elainella sp.]